MKKRTLKLLDEGLYTLEKYSLMKDSGSDSAFHHISINMVDIKILRASLKNPILIDLDKWSKLFLALQLRSAELGESAEINDEILLSSLERYKNSAEFQTLDDEYNVGITVDELQSVVNNENKIYTAEEVAAAIFLLENPSLFGELGCMQIKGEDYNNTTIH